MILLRSLAFFLIQSALTIIWSLLSLLTFPFPPLARYRFITIWSRMVVRLARALCGIRYEVRGLDNLPDRPAIVLSKHQSAWETLALQMFLPPQVWVIKRELLRVPFFGWGLAMMSPIAIDRTAGRQALRQMLEQGEERLRQGFWIVIFPEGHRFPPREKGPYHIGGAWLAARAGAPVVPIAHNAGYLWPRHSFLKHPGKITVSIGPAIDPKGMKPDEINSKVEAWIEGECGRLGDGRAG